MKAVYKSDMNKKATQELFDDFRASHSIYSDDYYPFTPSKLTHVLLLPLLGDVVHPYTEGQYTPDSDFQKEVLEVAWKEGLPLLLIPEREYADKVGENLVASKFKDCRGVVAMITDYNPARNNKEGEEQPAVTMRTAMQAHVYSASWAFNDLINATVYTDMLLLVRRNEREIELTDLIESRFEEVAEFLVPDIKKQLMDAYNKLQPATIERLSFMIMHSPLNEEEREDLLFERDLSARREKLASLLSLHREKLSLRAELSQRTMTELGQKQKAEFLRAQIRTMQQELNMDNDDQEDNELRNRAAQKEWSEATAQAFEKEMRKLLRYATNSPEYAMQWAYLDTFLNLPWNHCDNSDFELDDVERILNRDHYALDKVKERIIEQMAVLKLRKDTKSPILCLVGPPGVGKTSLGKSVAEALGRKYVRVALGGVHDEAEIRGHRRTYLGSMPGRIIQALESCNTSDPVMVLDEIDKLGADYKGDPQSALLEVLDPEQNSHFHDNYLDHDYDLSKVLFIATANGLDTITGPLLDRMEVIEIGGYVEDEKIEIAKRHLVGRNLERHGLQDGDVSFSDEALHEIINFYTRESGVRQLEKRIAEIMRKVARAKVSNRSYNANIGKEDVRQLLGKQTNYPDKYENNNLAGVVTGLAWTQAGGEILFIEASVSEGKDSKLTLTGNLGDVMKESAILALQYLKAHTALLGVDHTLFQNKELHIHVPEGAIPKDGPSAGITMLTAIASAFTNRKVRNKVAMTGELTLRGKVLPVGGIKEKILAAKRAGIRDVVLSEQNRKDIEEIPSHYVSDMTFHFVETAGEVLDFTLLEETAD